VTVTAVPVDDVVERRPCCSARSLQLLRLCSVDIKKKVYNRTRLGFLTLEFGSPMVRVSNRRTESVFGWGGRGTKQKRAKG